MTHSVADIVVMRPAFRRRASRSAMTPPCCSAASPGRSEHVLEGTCAVQAFVNVEIGSLHSTRAATTARPHRPASSEENRGTLEQISLTLIMSSAFGVRLVAAQTHPRPPPSIRRTLSIRDAEPRCRASAAFFLPRDAPMTVIRRPNARTEAVPEAPRWSPRTPC